jgi:hypothetical protein
VTLVFDKRGTGSWREWLDASLADLAQDALAGLDFLRGRAEVDPGATGCGHRARAHGSPSPRARATPKRRALADLVAPGQLALFAASPLAQGPMPARRSARLRVRDSLERERGTGHGNGHEDRAHYLLLLPERARVR